MKPTLLILAAGMGSRYGGIKQIDPFGPNGETIWYCTAPPVHSYRKHNVQTGRFYDLGEVRELHSCLQQ